MNSVKIDNIYMDTVHYREKAMRMRREGATYSEIREVLPVSKATLSSWLSKIDLTESERNVLAKKQEHSMQKGRERAVVSHRMHKVIREGVLYRDASRELSLFKKDPFFMLGLGLFMGIKQETSLLTLTTSNPQIVRIALSWLRTYTGIEETQATIRPFVSDKAHRHKSYEYWRGELGEVVKVATPFVQQKHSKRHGEKVRLEVGKVSAVKKVQMWQKMILEQKGK